MWVGVEAALKKGVTDSSVNLAARPILAPNKQAAVSQSERV